MQTIIKWGETYNDEMILEFCLNMARIKEFLRCPCARGRPFIASRITKRTAPDKGNGKAVEDRPGMRLGS